jgi:enoyl-CoA hydratase/carnithine racemase
MMCDLMVAADNAKFSYPEAKLGFTGGLISALPTRIPHKIAMELIMLCKTIDARRAYEVGLVNQVVPTGTQVEAALAMARELATFAPLVLKTIKRFVINDVMPQGPSEKMGRAMRELGKVRESEDGQEGARAFREKRAPVWKGR